MGREAFKRIKTDTWHTIEYVDKPISRVRLYPLKETEEPPEAKSIRESTWKERLLERKTVLEEACPDSEYEIHYDEETGNDALFDMKDNGRKRMWAGTTITLARYGMYDDIGLAIGTHPISYTNWIACFNPKYAEVFEKEGLPPPYAGMGVSVLMETPDGFFPLTRRGIETPVYPGMLYSPGGGPKPGESSSEAMLKEIVEETGLKSDIHFDPENIHVMAFVSDTNFAGSKHSRPELVAYLPIDPTFRQVEQIQYETAKKKGRETDVWNIVPISTYPVNLEREILFNGYQMCPPTEAGLAYASHLINKREGQPAFENLNKLTEGIKQYKRTPFRPPIQTMRDI